MLLLAPKDPRRRIDLRGDSSAPPTSAMRSAMADAPSGGYGDDDPSIMALQHLCAEMFAKDAALFVPTVTMANLITVMHACRPGEQVIVDEDSHIYRNELSGMTRIGGAFPQVVPRLGAAPDVGAVRARFDHNGVHAEPIRLVWTENSHESSGGQVMDSSLVAILGKLAHKHDARLAVDGARIFNASTHLKIGVDYLCAAADTVAVGLTKALAVPAGAILVGDAEFIHTAKQLRRLLGGNIKKAGPFAAAAIVALNNDLHRIEEDHQVATQIGAAIQASDGLRLAAPVETNLIRVDTSAVGSGTYCEQMLASHGVLVKSHGPTTIRFASHRGVHTDDISLIKKAIDALCDTPHPLTPPNTATPP